MEEETTGPEEDPSVTCHLGKDQATSMAEVPAGTFTEDHTTQHHQRYNQQMKQNY